MIERQLLKDMGFTQESEHIMVHQCGIIVIYTIVPDRDNIQVNENDYVSTFVQIETSRIEKAIFMRLYSAPHIVRTTNITYVYGIRCMPDDFFRYFLEQYKDYVKKEYKELILWKIGLNLF